MRLPPWSVDFDFESKREIIRVKDPATGETVEQWTGDYIFENEWQSFRTKKDRTLELTSAYHETDKKRVKVAVKVVDIFGNDTFSNRFTGFAYSDFLLGIPTTAARAFAPIKQSAMEQYYSSFIQDQFRIRLACGRIVSTGEGADAVEGKIKLTQGVGVGLAESWLGGQERVDEKVGVIQGCAGKVINPHDDKIGPAVGNRGRPEVVDAAHD